MNRQTRRNAEQVLRTLGTAEREAAHKVAKLESELSEAVRSRKTIVDAAADTMLPDLEPKTLRKLRHQMPNFVTPEVDSLFADAAAVSVPWSHTFHRAAYRKRTHEQKFMQLRARLLAAIDARQDSSLGLSRVHSITEEVARLQAERDAAVSDLDTIRQRVARFDGLIKAPGQNRTEKFERDMDELAKQARRAEDPSDDSLDIMLYATTGIPTSGRTLLWDTFFADHHGHANEPVFHGGGGDSSGGGASGSFDAPADTAQASIGSTEEPVQHVVDGGLGALS